MEFQFLQFLKDPFVSIETWLHELLIGWNVPALWVDVISLAVGAFILGLAVLLASFFFVWYERKIAARIGRRLGLDTSKAFGEPPGLLRIFRAAVKTFTTEDVAPANADRWVFHVAPIVLLTCAVFGWAVIPLGQGIIGSDLNIGIFYALSVGSGGMFAVLMTGWGMNNEYALLAALRGVAALISYEIPQILTVVAIVMVAGSFSMQRIVEAQDVAFLFALPLTALLFLASSLSRLGWRSFDLVKADSEIEAAFLTGYSGVKAGMCYLAESMNRLMMAVLFSTLFLGGWRGPWIDQAPVLGTVWLVVKTMLAMLAIQMIQHTWPRLRVGQILTFNWQFLTPLALVNLCTLALVGKLTPLDVGPWIRTGVFLLTNVALALAALILLAVFRRSSARRPSGPQ
jgi:NADH-quinone oxidoreductase subunit H